MSDSLYLSRQLDLALHGDAWHGPAWKEVLDGVTADDSDRRPMAGAHTIREILLHATTWNDVVRRRLEGDAPDVSDREDWPDPEEPRAWDALIERFFDRGVALRECVAAFPPERLRESRPGAGAGTWMDLILGQLQHLTCHAGQVAILMKGLSVAL